METAGEGEREREQFDRHIGGVSRIEQFSPRCVCKWTGQPAMSPYITAPVTAGDGRQTKSPSECKCDGAATLLWIWSNCRPGSGARLQACARGHLLYLHMHWQRHTHSNTPLPLSHSYLFSKKIEHCGGMCVCCCVCVCLCWRVFEADSGLVSRGSSMFVFPFVAVKRKPQ